MDSMLPNYHFKLLMRGSNDRDVVKWLKSRGKFNTEGMYELSHLMANKPENYKALFQLLDKYHLNESSED